MKINEAFLARMREATQLLQSDGPMAATAAIQRALHGEVRPENEMPQTERPPLPPQEPELRDINPRPESEQETPQPVSDLLSRFRHLSGGKWIRESAQPIEDVDTVDAGIPDKGRFLTGSSTNHAGTRAYKLYVPSGYGGEALPLIVMLHGCTQNPDDFAAGTGMNRVAEDNNCFVLYPAQAKSANASHCWNWFNASDQRRDSGEPSIIADITRKIAREYQVDTSRIYVAGLSAGGAMAAVMGATYPDLYAAVGIHSGLPYACARDMPSAFAAMKAGRAKASALKPGAQKPGVKAPESLGHAMPVIVFHGDRDTTVHPANGERVLSQCISAHASASDAESDGRMRTERGTAASGRAYSKTVIHDKDGKAIAEKWVLHGAPHAWSGGSSKGSYTDPAGPDASREMLRFFYTHSRNKA
jgi:poly(hydroxyalkanoate) depolymerase family esterase